MVVVENDELIFQILFKQILTHLEILIEINFLLYGRILSYYVTSTIWIIFSKNDSQVQILFLHYEFLNS
jgi:hypothetical protein